MEANKSKKQVLAALAKNRSVSGIVLAGFSSIYACRNGLR